MGLKEVQEKSNCIHELDPATAEYDKRFGRRGVCKKCGAKIVAWITAKVKHSAPGEGKKHMSKKDRRRAKAAGHA